MSVAAAQFEREFEDYTECRDCGEPLGDWAHDPWYPGRCEDCTAAYWRHIDTKIDERKEED